MSEIVDITVGIIQEEITISAVNNIGEVTVNAVSNSEEVNITANTNLIQINISTAPVTIINPQDYDLSQFTNTSPNPFVQQSGLASYVPISRNITINGITQDLSADRTFTISTGITIGTTAITSGTVGRVLFEGAGNVVQESANLFWDNANGTLEATTTADNLFGLKLKSITGQLRIKPFLNATYGVLLESKNIADSAYLPMSYSSSKHLFLDGNVIINSTSDSGFKLDVNGTTRLGGQVNFSTNVSASTTSAFGLNYINFNALTANQGISASFAPNGTPGGYAYNFQFAKSSTANVNSLLFIGGGASAGPAANKHLITTSTDGTATAQPLAFAVATGSWSSATPLMTLTPTQNVLIGTTTDAGYKLDINGSTRLKGAGTTVGTTSLIVQNSAGTTSLTCYDDLSIYIDGKNSSGFATNIRIGGQSNQATISFFGNNNIYVGQATAIENIPSALIAMGSTTKGLLIPRMTNTQVLAITTPATGLQAYDTTNNKLMVYDATAWRNIATENWVTSQGYLTTQPWVVSGSNIYYSTGLVGIGTATPFSGATNVISSLQLGSSSSNIDVGGFCSVGKITQNGYGAVGSNYYLDSGNQLRRKNADSVSVIDFSASGFLFKAASNGAVNSNIALVEYARFAPSSGNLLLNTTTDAGFRLDVNGTARVRGTGTSFTTTSFSVVNNANTSALSILDNLSVYFGGEIFGPSNFYINGPTNATGTIHLRPAILNLSTTNVQYNGTQFLGTGGGGNLRIGSVAAGYNILSFWVAGFETARIFNTGNWGINTMSDAGFRLDVNGTARVTSITATSNVIQTGGNANTFASIINHMGAAQSVAGLNTTRICASTDLSVGFAGGADASAVIEARSTTKGFLPPRMTTTQRNAIASPATGLQVYDTTLNRPCFYDGTTWITL